MYVFFQYNSLLVLLSVNQQHCRVHCTLGFFKVKQRLQKIVKHGSQEFLNSHCTNYSNLPCCLLPTQRSIYDFSNKKSNAFRLPNGGMPVMASDSNMLPPHYLFIYLCIALMKFFSLHCNSSHHKKQKPFQKCMIFVGLMLLLLIQPKSIKMQLLFRNTDVKVIILTAFQI